MKILLTGPTQRMVNSQKLRYDYLTSVYLLVKVLTALGHTVDHRRVQYGEDLSKYDLALLGACPPKSFTSRHITGTAWALEKVKRSVLFCDDWSIANMGTMVRNTLKNWKQYTDWFGKLEKPLETSEEAAVKTFLTRVTHDNTLRLLAPMTPWGNHKTLMDGNLPVTQLRWWDPSPVVVVPSYQPAKARVKQWVYATLQKHDVWLDKLNCKWEVAKFGNSRSGHEYVPEKEILQVYANSWGVLCPRYNRAGSGWWRVRYHFAAHVRSVLKADIIDAAYMDDSYKKSVKTIEELSPAELEKLAQKQRNWFFGNISTRKQCYDQVEEAIAR